jgi:enhancer of polycomb-like protein
VARRLSVHKSRNDGDSLSTPTEAVVRPRERFAQIQAAVERDVASRKEKDTPHWEDTIDNPYQARPVPYPERLMRFISPSTAQAKADREEGRPRQGQALRLRVGRGGRLHLDRRRPPPFAEEEVHPFLRAEEVEDSDETEENEMDDSAFDMFELEMEDTRRRLAEQWMFDEDDGPAVGPFGSEEQDRVLVDDFQAK